MSASNVVKQYAVFGLHAPTLTQARVSREEDDDTLMGMLSVLPGILFLAPFSATLLRVSIAITFGFAAWGHSSRPFVFARILAAVEIATAAVIAAGAWTQVGAIAGVLVIGAWVFLPALRPVALGTSLLALFMCLSLILTGAGAIAFDLPL